MRLISWIVGGVASAALVLGACADEDPLGVGGALLPDTVIMTLDTVIDAADYLQLDTTFGGYGGAASAGFVLVAQDYAGTLDAHALVRFEPLQSVVTYRDADGTLRIDSFPVFEYGEVVFSVDTLRFEAAGPVKLALYEVAEEWDPATATWTFRVDSPGLEQSWTQPGGTPGALLDTVSVVAGQDSVFFRVDTATISRWRDTTDARRGALIVAETPDSRIRSAVLGVGAPFFMRGYARPSPLPDTVVTVVASARRSTFVYDPPPPPAGSDLRVGGVPAHRAVVAFDPDLGDMVLRGCGAGDSECIRLRDVIVNRATLLLETQAVDAPFTPEDSVHFRARVMIPTPLAPMSRFPLGDSVGSASLPASAFTTAGAPVPVNVPLTRFVSVLANDTSSTPINVIGLIARRTIGVSSENATFGFGAFAPLPRLRIVASWAKWEESE